MPQDSQMTEEDKRARIAYVETEWKHKHEALEKAQGITLTWLFTTHAGGIAGSLGRIATDKGNYSAVVALIAFALGLVSLLTFGILLFYKEEWHFEDYRKRVNLHLKGKLTWEEFIDREEVRPFKYKHCELAAWMSVAMALAGLISLSASVLR